MSLTKQSSLALGLAALLVVSLVGPSAAEIWELQDGQPVPALPPGGAALFDAAAVRKAVEAVRDAEAAAAVVETQRAELAEKDRQIADLKSALQAAAGEAAKRDQAWALAEERFKLQSDNYDKLSLVIAKQNELLDKTGALMDRQTAALSKAQERIESLEKRQFWSMILGPLIGGALIFFSGGILGH